MQQIGRHPAHLRIGCLHLKPGFGLVLAHYLQIGVFGILADDLVDASGQLVHQIDREPVDGLWPTTSWQPGRPVSDRYALLLPGSLPVGDYQLLLVVYDPLTGERLPTATGDALMIADIAVVAQETRP